LGTEKSKCASLGTKVRGDSGKVVLAGTGARIRKGGKDDKWRVGEY